MFKTGIVTRLLENLHAAARVQGEDEAAVKAILPGGVGSLREGGSEEASGGQASGGFIGNVVVQGLVEPSLIEDFEKRVNEKLILSPIQKSSEKARQVVCSAELIVAHRLGNGFQNSRVDSVNAEAVTRTRPDLGEVLFVLPVRVGVSKREHVDEAVDIILVTTRRFINVLVRRLAVQLVPGSHLMRASLRVRDNFAILGTDAVLP